jgi:hypothetical protein
LHLKYIIEEAAVIIHWFHNHEPARSHLLEIQRRDLPRGQRPVGLLKSIVTRWTSTYTAHARIERLAPHLMTLATGIAKERLQEVLSKDRDAQRKAEWILAKLRRDSFWQKLRIGNFHLRKLAISAMILQQDQLRLDHVAFMLGYLYRHFYAIQENDDADDMSKVNNLPLIIIWWGVANKFKFTEYC